MIKLPAKPVAIKAFAMTTPLGDELTEISNNILSGSLTGMINDSELLNNGITVVGKIKNYIAPLGARFSDYDYRANRLLAHTLNKIQPELDQLLKKTPAHKVGVILATSTAGVDSLESALVIRDNTGQWPSHYQAHHQRMGSISEFVASYLQLTGPALTISTACSSAAKAIASAKKWLNSGLCDIVISGGVDVLCQLTLNGFDSLGALSNSQCQPFSENRKGINIGEACALFVLARGDAEFMLIGAGASSDAYHISAPDPSGEGAIKSMQVALDDAQYPVTAIDYINLHGTGTPQNDAMESQAIHQLFVDTEVVCSSSKPQIGHTLGVSGAVELGLSLLSMSAFNTHNSYLPHVYDGYYDCKLPALKLATINNQLGRPKVTLSNSFAFGGSNASLIIGVT